MLELLQCVQHLEKLKVITSDKILDSDFRWWEWLRQVYPKIIEKKWQIKKVSKISHIAMIIHKKDKNQFFLRET